MSPWALWPCCHTVDTRAEVVEHSCEKWSPPTPARPLPTLANWSETCDWGHCNGQSYAVRWADDLGLWLPVCRKHRAGDVVLFDDLDDAA